MFFMIFRDFFNILFNFILIFRYTYCMLILKEEIAMAETELKLREMIIEKYGSLKKFCEIIDMPWTTLDSILKRGVANSNITNVMKITKELGIDTESLASGTIIESINKIRNHQTIAAHKEGENFTPEELEKIEEYKKLLLAARPKE